ncbi:hypothetical protein PsYK624_054960 [Phanerochaete sordida]|uniref:Uncharacterized protein n=1 Tax=Phanerochaete sordida TaxID=48140 RepID=A0A9P3LBE4_9APHY|nr:hypothetical protein PsYK624_054960 [Phanerochaete sordida]
MLLASHPSSSALVRPPDFYPSNPLTCCAEQANLQRSQRTAPRFRVGAATGTTVRFAAGHVIQSAYTTLKHNCHPCRSLVDQVHSGQCTRTVFTGAINRLRFDMEMRPIYEHAYKQVQVLASGASLYLYDIDEVAYVGGFASPPGLDEALAAGLSEDVVTPFTAGTVVGGGVGDPTTLLARGAVLWAKLLAALGEGTPEEREVKAAFAPGHALQSVKATTRTLGLLFPEDGAESALGGQWVPVVLRETAPPARLAVRLDVEVGKGAHVAFEVWKAKEGVKITKEVPTKLEGDEDEEDEEEEIETKEKTRRRRSRRRRSSPRSRSRRTGRARSTAACARRSRCSSS